MTSDKKNDTYNEKVNDMRTGEARGFNIKTLAKRAKLSLRTVRYYSHKGLLQKPKGGGSRQYYTEDHLNRLEAIKRLTKQRVPLDEMPKLFQEVKMVIARPPKGLDMKPLMMEAALQVPKKPLMNIDFKVMKNDSLWVEKREYEPEESPQITEDRWTRIRIGPDIEINFRANALSEEKETMIKNIIRSVIGKESNWEE